MGVRLITVLFVFGIATCKPRVENPSASQLQFDEEKGACPDFRGGTGIADRTFDNLKNRLDEATQAEDKSGALPHLTNMVTEFDRAILPGLYCLKGWQSNRQSPVSSAFPE